MPLLQQVLRIDALGLTSVVIQNAEQEVNWVATSELEDPAPYLNGGEILLTTGLGSRDWLGGWSEYAERLKTVGVVAIGFGIGLSHLQVPEQLRAACEANRLGLFVVPEETPFIAIGKGVGDLLAADDRRSLTDALALQRELTLAVTAGGAEAVLEKLARLLEGAAVILDADGLVTAASHPAGDLPEGVHGIALSYLERIRPLGLRGSAAHLSGELSLIIQPLGLSGTPSSYLMVAATRQWSPAQRSSITTGVALLSVDAERQSDRRETERQVRTGVIALLLAGQHAAAEALLSIVPGTSRLPGRIQVVLASAPAGARHLLRALERRSAEVAHLVLASDISDFTVVVEAGARNVEAVENLLLALGAQVGVGSPASLAGASHSSASARSALSRTSEHRPLVRFSELAATGVAAVVDDDALASFSRELLGPMHAIGREGEALLATIRAFLDAHGHHQPAATALGIHRNTLRKRLGRIEEILALSLDDPQTRVNLWVAIQAQDYAEPEP